MTTLLIVRTPGGHRREIPLSAAAVTIGRDTACDVVLDSRQVSRMHARVEPQANGYTAVDCGSTNGTYLNGSLIEEPQLLAPGDIIALGDVFLTFLERSAVGLVIALDRASELLARPQPAQRRHGLWVVDDVIECASGLGDTALTQRALQLKMGALNPTPGAIGESVIHSTVSIGRADLRAMSSPVDRVAVMITDIQDSTPLTARLGDEKWMEFLRAHNKIVRRRISAHNGFEVRSTGDGEMIVFDEAEGAVLAAMAMQRDFDVFNRERPEMSARIRIGIHVGEVIREGDDFFGKAVVIAARVVSNADGGEILVSEAVEQLTKDLPKIEFGERRSVEMKGLPGKHIVVPVRW